GAGGASITTPVRELDGARFDEPRGEAAAPEADRGARPERPRERAPARDRGSEDVRREMPRSCGRSSERRVEQEVDLVAAALLEPMGIPELQRRVEVPEVRKLEHQLPAHAHLQLVEREGPVERPA